MTLYLLVGALWTSEPTYSYIFPLDPSKLYSMVALHDTGPVDIETISHEEYSVAFKLFPFLDNRAAQVTFCAKVMPPANSCYNLTDIKVEAEIRDPTKDPNDMENLMGCCAGDHRLIGYLSINIVLHDVISHCQLFYSCRKCEHLHLHVRC